MLRRRYFILIHVFTWFYICTYFQVKDAENLLKAWKTEMSTMYETYQKLQFFSVSKILLLHEALTENYSVNKVMQELGFLFKSDEEAIPILKKAIEVHICMSCM